MAQAYWSGHYTLAQVGDHYWRELRHRESSSKTGGKRFEHVKCKACPLHLLARSGLWRDLLPLAK